MAVQEIVRFSSAALAPGVGPSQIYSNLTLTTPLPPHNQATPWWRGERSLERVSITLEAEWVREWGTGLVVKPGLHESYLTVLPLVIH